MSTPNIAEDELPGIAKGYKVSAKVGVDDLMNKDAEDESLNRYKEKLLQKDACPFPDNPRNLIVKDLVVECDGRPPIRFDPNENGFFFVLKEGTDYTIKIGFYVQREIVSCLKYMNFVRKMNVRVDTTQMNLGSYGPSKDLVHVVVEQDRTPSGMLGRGKYKAVARLIDDDLNIYLEVNYSFGKTTEFSSHIIRDQKDMGVIHPYLMYTSTYPKPLR